MQIGRDTEGTMKKVNRKLWGVCLLTVMILFLGLGNQTTAYGFGGGWGRDNDHSQDDIGSAKRNNLISFENSKVDAGVPLTVVGANEDAVYNWTIISADGKENKFTTTDNFYTPSEADIEKLITVSVENLEEAKAAIYYSTLPVVYINNSTGYYSVGDEYSDADMSMQGNAAYNSDEQLFQGEISIRLRGNSTKWREKKPFNIKLDTKTDLLGMGESKHWAMLANDIDHTLMRNKLLYDFSGAIGMDSYMKSENVIVVFNNQYYGVYQLCELVNIEAERVAIYDWEESAEAAADAIVTKLVEEDSVAEVDADAAKSNLEDAMCADMSWITEPYSFSYDVDLDGIKETYTITDYMELPAATGGVLVEMDFYAFDGNNVSTMITAYSQPMYFKTPEFAITNPTLFKYTQTYLQAFEYAIHSTDFSYHESEKKYKSYSQLGGNSDIGYKESDFTAAEYDGKHYSELFDLDSLVQNYLVCEFSMNWDSMKNSVFFYKDIDGLFRIGPEWDFDWAFGNINMYNINTWYPTSWHTTENDFTVEQYYQTVQWNRNLIRDPYFLVQIFEKYHEIRGTIIEDMIKTGGTIETLEAQLTDAAAANDTKWSYTYNQYRSVGFHESIENMMDFINTRIIWLDEQFTSINTLMSSLGYYDPSTDLTVTKIDAKSFEGYTEITAKVTGMDIAYVTFQVNGTHTYTAEVTEGQAVCPVSNEDLMTEADKLNVVQILAKNSSDEYIIEENEEGNYANAKSNFAVFDRKDGIISLTEETLESATADIADNADAQEDTTGQEVVTQYTSDQDESESGYDYVVLIITVVLGIVLTAIGAFAVISNRKKNR